MLVRRSSLRIGLLQVALIAGLASAAGPESVTLPEPLRNDPAYAKYAAIVLQIELLQNPATAYLPIVVDAPQEGVLTIQGTVPSGRVKQLILQAAERLTGLRTRETLRIAAVPAEPQASPNVKLTELEPATRETLALFPEHAARVKSTVGRDGMVTLSGIISSHEARLLLSQAVKSQPGCRAVINRVTVPADPLTQRVAVTEDGAETLLARQLPRLPDMSFLATLEEARPAERDNPGARIASDDAPPTDVVDQQMVEDVNNALRKEPDLASAKLEVEVLSGTVILAGNLKNRQQVELAVATAAECHGVTKVVAKCRPVSIQRYRPKSYDAASNAKKPPIADANKQRKLLGFIPWGTKSNIPEPINPAQAAGNRKFRDAVRKTLLRRCGDAVASLSLNAGLDGVLRIDGKVDSPQQRATVFKQLDNLVELRNVNYDCVLQIKELSE